MSPSPAAQSWLPWILASALVVFLVACVILYCCCVSSSPIDAADPTPEDTMRLREVSIIEANQWTKAEGHKAELGSGAYGSVYIARSIASGRTFAVKEIDLDYLIQCKADPAKRAVRAEEFDRMCNEVKLLSQLRHPNIVAHKGEQLSISRRKLYIFMEYIAGGTLKDSLKQYGPMTPHMIQGYLEHIICGLGFLHSQTPCIVHRDIKPANILLDNGVCKIADLGTAKIIAKNTKNKFRAGTTLYAPPEMHSSNAETTPSFDVWSLGVTLHELNTGATPWTEEQRRKPKLLVRYLTHRYATEPVQLSNELLPSLKDMISRMLRFAASARPALIELREHPFSQENFSTGSDKTSPSTNRVLSKLQKLRDGISVTATSQTCALDVTNSPHVTLTQDTQCGYTI